MTLTITRKTALAFFDAYTDPDIDKRLYFDVWADRTGLGSTQKRAVWREVRRQTYRVAVQKREATLRRKADAISHIGGAAANRPTAIAETEC